MTDNISKPETYVSDNVDDMVTGDLRKVIDPWIEPEETGDAPAGFRDNNQTKRKNRWEYIKDIYTDLVDELSDIDRVVAIQLGYIRGRIGDPPIGIAVALKHSRSSITTTVLPNEILERTKNEELRLVDESPGTNVRCRVVVLTLPSINQD